MDPATAIKEACAESHCTSYKAKLDECNDRVKSKNKTTETCFEEILDFYHCVDHCAASSIFQVCRMIGKLVSDVLLVYLHLLSCVYISSYFFFSM